MVRRMSRVSAKNCIVACRRSRAATSLASRRAARSCAQRKKALTPVTTASSPVSEARR
jgi:hypothetical protein